jgi:delta1-piperideine-2-carboxylate reductase
MATLSLELGEICDLASLALSENGCDAANTGALVRTIYAAERDGAAAHGLFRLPGYIASLRSGKVNGRADPKVAHKTPVIVSVHGDNGFAPLALDRGVPVLAKAAKEFGVAVMAVTHVHHFAALWPEVEKLAAEGLIGMACVNYVPVVAPAGGVRPIFGTNPLAIAWPRPGRDPVVLDMATSAMSRGEVTIAARDGKSVPPGTGLDAKGKPSTDPNEILKGVLLPFGGYKGSGLALMVELLAAAAVGERFSFETAAEDNKDGGPPRGGEFMLAMSPDLMAGTGWAEHAEGFFAQFDGIEGARLPGARRMASRKDVGARRVDAKLVETIKALTV